MAEEQKKQDEEQTEPVDNPQEEKAEAPDPIPDREAAMESVRSSFMRDVYSKRAASREEDDDLEQLVPDEPDPGLPPLTNEQDKLMFGMSTMRPTERITTGVSGRSGHIPVPREVVAAIPLLARLAKRPDAPKEVLQILTALDRETR